MPTGYRCISEWDNPPDPQRPALPYRSKLTLSIRQHIPPEPFGHGYHQKFWPPKAKDNKLIKHFPSEWCLKRAPEVTPAHPDTTVHNLYIIDEIACEDRRGAQIVRCHVDEDQGQIYVAKIYDPLYYSYEDKENGMPVDIVWEADHDYSREAAAYEQLQQSKVDGKFTPKYFGSWTFNLSLAGVERSVRMILLEWVPGISMWSLLQNRQVLRLSPELRLEVFARALEVSTTVLFNEVDQKDFAPRNIIIVGLDFKAQTVDKVLLIDFNKSIVFTHSNCMRFNYDTDLPMSPRYSWWRECPDEFITWVPSPHRFKEKIFKGWLKVRWKDGAGEFSGPEDFMKEHNDYEEPVEMAPPKQERELPRFIPDRDDPCFGRWDSSESSGTE